MTEHIISSQYPVRVTRYVADDGKAFASFSYRTEIIPKDRYEKIAEKLAEQTLAQLIRRLKQAQRELSRAQHRHDRDPRPGFKAVLATKVYHWRRVLELVAQELSFRGTEQALLARLSRLTARQIKHMLSKSHRAWRELRFAQPK